MRRSYWLQCQYWLNLGRIISSSELIDLWYRGVKPCLLFPLFQVSPLIAYCLNWGNAYLGFYYQQVTNGHFFLKKKKLFFVVICRKFILCQISWVYRCFVHGEKTTILSYDYLIWKVFHIYADISLTKLLGSQ